MYGSRHAIGLGILILLALSGNVLARNTDERFPNVALTLTAYNLPITIPDEGGNFAYNVEIGNGEAASLAFEVWTTFTLPDGGGNAAGYSPVELLLPGGWSAREDPTQAVSGGMPSGPYIYTAFAGIYPDEIWGSDSFEFEKLPGAAGWYAQSPGAENGLSGVSFVDANTGWAVSTYREILHTTDGGDIWQQQDDGQYYPQSYNDVHFVNAQTGWVVGDTILHTTDGGATWIAGDPYYDYDLNKVFFLDTDNGWAVGGFYDLFGSNHRRVIEHTSDGGEVWEGQHWQSYRYPLQSVHFADKNNGWAVGGPGYILHTSNGGDDWAEQNSGTSSYLQDVFFFDADLGWCVGDGGTVRHTTDGGTTWQAQSPGQSAEFRSVFFSDAVTGWIAGVDYNLNLPVIRHTEDGGLTWQTQDTQTGSDLIVLKDICFVDSNHGWVAGQLWPDIGVMLHTENGGGGLVATDIGELGLQDAAPERARVSAPFPNPFNPLTRIRFSVPGGVSQPVTLAVFDIQGRRIRSLVNGIQEPGEHIVDWDGLTDSRVPATSGVYMYRATIGGFTTSGKMILLR